jgi:competence protein ComEC
MKVKNVVIGIQYENSSQYEKVINIIKEKEIKLIIAKKGDILKLEENVKINIMWPDAKNKIDENVLNNNSLVFKLESYDFSIIFTGDIEEKAERKLIAKENSILKSDMIKLAHHGSKTSSIKEFISAVNPKIAIASVRKR